MTNEQLLTDIREANLTYLMLAQNLIRQDKAEALFRLGMSEEAADMIAALSTSTDSPHCFGQHVVVPVPGRRRCGVEPADQPHSEQG